MSNFQDLNRHIPNTPDFSAIMEAQNSRLASGYYERLMEMISDFDESLDSEHDAGIRLVNFGKEVTFHIESLGYYNPGLITFHGITKDGHPVKLVQHISQISVLLMEMPRLNPDKPKIGFSQKQNKEEDR